MQKKKGISLIVLVITIIVMIILAATIILSLNNAGIIGNANQAVFKQNVKNYLSELDLYYMDELISNSGVNTKEISATATTTPSIKDLIPSISEEDKTKFRVAGGKLIYLGANRNEYEWCRELGILIDSTKLSQEEYETLYAEEIAYSESIGGEADEWDGGGYIIPYGTELENDIIVLPYGTEVIGFSAFGGMTEIKDVIIPNTVVGIEAWAFLGCKGITELILPDSVKYISSSFQDCSNLEYIELSNNLEYIWDGAFNKCTSLNNLELPRTLKSIEKGTMVFSSCTNLKAINVEEGNAEFTSENGVLYNKDKTEIIAVPGGKTGSFVIPNSVITISYHCFEGCNKLTSITIPNSVTTIKSAAFQSCSSLKSITIPDSVSNLEEWMFHSCSGLTQIKLPSTITKIGTNMFAYCSNLKEIYIPSTVVSIEGGFSYCHSLKNIYIAGENFASADSIKANFKTIAEGSTIYVKNATIASYLDGKYDTSKTTISTNYNW